MSSLRAAMAQDQTPHAHWAIYLLVLGLALAIAWAALAQVDVVTRADARVVPDGREQVIASLEGGILRKLSVREGDEVQPGDELAQIDPTRVEAQQNEGRAKRLALLAATARLQAEAAGQPLHFPPELRGVPGLTAGETAAYTARRRSLDEALSSNQRSVALLLGEVEVAERMSASGLLSNVELMRLQRQVNEMRLQGQERINRFRQDASSELVRVQTELAQLDEQLAGRDDVLRRTVIRSPVRGLVKNIRTATLGGVVAPGAPMLEILPLGARILVEARVKPADIGWVQVGQTAKIKLSAYDYNVYGGLEGRIEYVSPDAMGDTERPNASDATYYRARISADRSTLRAQGHPLEVRPGMTGTAEISTSERTVLSFLLRPMMKSREAFRER